MVRWNPVKEFFAGFCFVKRDPMEEARRSWRELRKQARNDLLNRAPRARTRVFLIAHDPR